VTKSILIVDDDQGIQGILQRILEEEGYTVDTAEDGLIALEKLERRKVDLILLDLMMPRMDGYAFVAEFQRRGWQASIPFIVLSANVRAQVDHLGAQSFLTKPFDIDMLLQTISQMGEAHGSPHTRGTDSR
jgi:CheY-like chemotaxis protein